LVFLSDNMNFSGGRKLLFEYASFLRKRGHKVDVLVQKEKGSLKGTLSVTIVNAFNRDEIPECDLIIATTPREVKNAYDSKRGDVIHFCQGYEITDLNQRVNGKVIPPRYQSKSLFSKFTILRKKLSWRKKIKRIDNIYRLPTVLLTVSKHLQKELELIYSRKVFLCENGIHNEYFYPQKDFHWNKFTPEKPLKIINIGPHKVTFKGINTTLKAIEILKKKNFPIMLIRVAPHIEQHEYDNPIIDKCYENIPPENLGELLRNSHVYISNSTEGEGFGLPALEAISSGLITILSSINSYKNFSNKKNFCYFIPEYDALKTAETIEKILTLPKNEIEKMRTSALSVAKKFSFKHSCETFEKILYKNLHKEKQVKKRK